MFRRIILRRVNSPVQRDADEDFQWLIDSIGLRGKDTSMRVFREMIRQISSSGRATSEEIASNLGMSIGCINYHLRQFMEAGLIERERAKLKLRGGNLRRSIEELRKDTQRMFDDMERIAEELDRKFF